MSVFRKEQLPNLGQLTHATFPPTWGAAGIACFVKETGTICGAGIGFFERMQRMQRM
jgi:hypothetical protein